MLRTPGMGKKLEDSTVKELQEKCAKKYSLTITTDEFKDLIKIMETKPEFELDHASINLRTL